MPAVGGCTGGGSTAMEARTAVRLGTSEATVIYPRSEKEMLTSDENHEAREEGEVDFNMASPWWNSGSRWKK